MEDPLMKDRETKDQPAAETPDPGEDSASEPPQSNTVPAPEPGPPARRDSEAGQSAGTGTGAGSSLAPQTGIGAHDSSAINANLSGLAAGTIRLVG